MKHIPLIIVFCAVGLLPIADCCFAGTCADFLLVGVGARAQGLGGAYTALADDVNSICWNPAGLSAIRCNEMTFTHNAWVLDTAYDFYGFASPLNVKKYKCVLGVGINYMNLGSFTGRKDQVSQPYDFSASNFVFSTGLGVRLNAGNSVGMNLKFIEENIEVATAQAFAVDLGWKHALNGSLQAGLVLQNLGAGMKYADREADLPLSLNAGLACRVSGAIDLGLDIKHELYTRNTSLAFGTEYLVSDLLTIRGGSLLGAAKYLTGGLNLGLTGGFGIKINNNRIDYAVAMLGDLGPTHKVSLSVKFR